MTDLRSLETWIQPQHLEEATLARYRDSFAAHPARLVVLTDFLVDAVAERLSRFLDCEAEFQPEFGCYSNDSGMTEAEWLAADESDRFFRLRKLVATPQQFRMSPNALTYLQFRRAFQSAQMREFFERISGLALGWSDDFGAHLMIEGDFLRPPSDDNRDRRLALVIYLSKEWRREYGGLLRLAHPDGSFTEVEPRYNTVIAFDVLASPAHLVMEVSATPDKWRRITIGGWYHKTPAQSAEESGEARH
jgi:hypothetical protein